MSYDDDATLDAAVRDLPVADHHAGFWAEVDRALAEVAADGDPGAIVAGAAVGINGSDPDPTPSPTPTVAGGISFLPARPSRRWQASIAWVATAAVILAAVVVVGGRDPAPQRVDIATPPDLGPAVATVIVIDYHLTGPDGFDGRFRLDAADDGSHRWARVGVAQGQSYDAETGIGLQLAVEDPAVPSGVRLVAVTGLPRGGPETALFGPPPPLQGLSDVVTSLARSGSDLVEEGEVLGRRVWRYDGPVAPSDGSRAPDHAVVEVDQATGVILSERMTIEGALYSEMTATTVEVDENVERSRFRLGSPGNEMEVVRELEFSSRTLDDAARQVGYPVLVPGTVPEGFLLDSVEVKTASTDRATESVEPATDPVVAMRWRNGFLAFTVSLRPTGGPGTVSDPIGGHMLRYRREPQRIDLVGRPPLDGGLVVDAPVRPHLWGVTGDLVVTVEGDLSADELIEVAGSLRAVEVAGTVNPDPEPPTSRVAPPTLRDQVEGRRRSSVWKTAGWPVTTPAPASARLS